MVTGCYVKCPRCKGRGFVRKDYEGRWLDCPVCWVGEDGVPVGWLALPLSPSMLHEEPWLSDYTWNANEEAA